MSCGALLNSPFLPGYPKNVLPVKEYIGMLLSFSLFALTEVNGTAVQSTYRRCHMLYLTLASKAYARNLQYRGAHMVHNLASAMFGYMYACLWIGIGADHSLGEYGTQGMVSYIAFTQSSLDLGFSPMDSEFLLQSGQGRSRWI